MGVNERVVLVKRGIQNSSIKILTTKNLVIDLFYN